MTPRLLMRNYFSTYFLWSARKASNLAQAIENSGAPGTFDMNHRAHVLTSILASAHFLEAAINELFQDAVDRHGLDEEGYLAPLSAHAVDAMAQVWTGTADGTKLRPLEKWQLLRICCRAEPLPKGEAPFQDADLVVQLRNAFVHHRPELVSADDAHKNEQKLMGKFPPNQLMAGSHSVNPWWPDHCLGAGCADWALTAVVALADRVTSDVGIKPNYRRQTFDAFASEVGNE